MQADSCTIVFEGSGDTPIRLQPKCNATIAQFLQAHSKLVGDIQANQITMNGRGLNLDHVMEVGQVITITLQSPEVAGVKSLRDLDVSPTAEWTQPVQDPIEVHSPPRKVSKFDVGQCPAPCKNAMPEQAWLDASPFLCLQGDQFLCLALPSITNVQQLWSVRHQFFRAEDRLRILDAQSHFMADDEMRFHLHALTLIHRDHQLKFPNPLTQVCVIDPLISSAWVQGRGFDCTFWAKDHTDIRDKGLLVITSMLVNKHWIPVFMSPVKDVLQVFTWDCIDACHDLLHSVVRKLAVGLGFASALIRREHRLFFTSELCGSLAIAFLRYALVGTQLPTDCHEALAVHSLIRDRFVQVLQGCQITDRPWVWGAGDAEPDAQTSPLATAPMVNISRDERIDLINAGSQCLMMRSGFTLSIWYRDKTHQTLCCVDLLPFSNL